MAEQLALFFNSRTIYHGPRGRSSAWTDVDEKSFVISREKRIFSRVKQECEPGVQGWNGSVLDAGQGRGAPVGAGYESGVCEAAARKRERRRAQKAGGTEGECAREGGRKNTGRRDGIAAGKGDLRGRALAEGEVEYGGEERKDAAGRISARRKETAALGNLNCRGAAEICRRGARRHRAGRCPRRKNCVITGSAPQGQGGDATWNSVSDLRNERIPP